MRQRLENPECEASIQDHRLPKFTARMGAVLSYTLVCMSTHLYFYIIVCLGFKGPHQGHGPEIANKVYVRHLEICSAERSTIAANKHSLGPHQQKNVGCNYHQLTCIKHPLANLLIWTMQNDCHHLIPTLYHVC